MVQDALVLMRVAGCAGLLQAGGQRHAQTGRVRGGDQLLRVGSPGSLEAGGKGVVSFEGRPSRP